MRSLTRRYLPGKFFHCVSIFILVVAGNHQRTESAQFHNFGCIHPSHTVCVTRKLLHLSKFKLDLHHPGTRSISTTTNVHAMASVKMRNSRQQSTGTSVEAVAMLFRRAPRPVEITETATLRQRLLSTRLINNTLPGSGATTGAILCS